MELSGAWRMTNRLQADEVGALAGCEGALLVIIGALIESGLAV